MLCLNLYRPSICLSLCGPWHCCGPLSPCRLSPICTSYWPSPTWISIVHHAAVSLYRPSLVWASITHRSHWVSIVHHHIWACRPLPSPGLYHSASSWISVVHHTIWICLSSLTMSEPLSSITVCAFIFHDPSIVLTLPWPYRPLLCLSLYRSSACLYLYRPSSCLPLLSVTQPRTFITHHLSETLSSITVSEPLCSMTLSEFLSPMYTSLIRHSAVTFCCSSSRLEPIKSIVRSLHNAVWASIVYPSRCLILY